MVQPIFKSVFPLFSKFFSAKSKNGHFEIVHFSFFEILNLVQKVKKRRFMVWLFWACSLSTGDGSEVCDSPTRG